MEQFTDILKTLGIDPALAGTGIILAIALRYLRGMVHWMNSEWTFVAALVLGLLGAWIKSEGLGVRGFAANTLSLACIVLIAQKVLENAAKVVPWLPQDNQWVKPEGGTK
jgi:hypothetical protein